MMEMFLWVKQSCADRSYGVRPLRRALQKFVEAPLSEALIEGRPTNSSLIEIYKADNDSLAIRPLAEEGLADLENLANGEGKDDESFMAGEMALR